MKRGYWITIAVCGALIGLGVPVTQNYLNQEALMFNFKPLADDYEFSFKGSFEEVNFTAHDGTKLNAVLFRAEKPKGLVVYYHGKGANIANKGAFVSKTFTKRNYDVIMMDYRGFGKTRGVLSEKLLLDDALHVYREMVPLYENIVVYGCSLGTSVATYVASRSTPKCLILESPYTNMVDLGKFTKPYIPRWVVKAIVKYPLQTNLFILDVTVPVHIFHGTSDKIIPIKSSHTLAELCKGRIPIDLTTIICGTHNHIAKHPDFHDKLDQILAN